ncbi:MAG: hypothetical protein EA369_03295 [Bradymonadales bacterium]|nr:MAG: hypothetical protein EA369_03295 [Bradymonadales bacterium]
MKKLFSTILLGMSGLMLGCGDERLAPDTNEGQPRGSETSQASESFQVEPNSEQTPEAIASYKAGDGFQFSGLQFRLRRGQVALTEKGLEGTGLLLVNGPLAPSIYSDALISVGFEVSDEDSSFAELMAFVRNDASQGIRLRMNSSSVILIGPQGQLTVVRENRTKRELSLEIHNSEDPSHIILWDQWEVGRFTDEIFDSALDAGPLGSRAFGRARGNFFGVELKNATLTRIERRSRIARPH